MLTPLYLSSDFFPVKMTNAHECSIF
jgi:hypothetical protein